MHNIQTIVGHPQKETGNKQDLALKCSAWKVFGTKDLGLVGL